MLNKEMLEGLFNKQLKDKLELLEKRNTKEMDCISVLKNNQESIDSIYNYII